MPRKLFLFAIITLFAICYFATIRDGHDWGDDFAMYIRHAMNIANGTNYADTGYVRNLSCFLPTAYPPVFPLLLLPIYKIFGLNLLVMKIEIILFFMASLGVIFLVFKNDLPFHYLVTIIAIIGLNPYFLQLKNHILSDIPFMFFVYTSLFIIHRVYQPNQRSKTKMLYPITLGILFYLSYGTRSVGLVSLASFIIYDIIKSKRLTRFAIIASLIFLTLAKLQNFILGGSGSNFWLPELNLKLMIQNLLSYISAFAFLWSNGYSIFLNKVLFYLISMFAIIGYWTRVRNRLTILEIFALFYTAVILIYTKPATPFDKIRYLIPIIPLYIFYAFGGVYRIGPLQREKIGKMIFTALSAVIFVSYIFAYTKLGHGPLEWGINTKESVELFNYIKDKTDQNDVIIFIKPRALSLFTERKASVYHIPNANQDLWDFFKRINASYFVEGSLDSSYWHYFIKKYKDNLQEVYSNLDFKVYKIKNFPNSHQ